MHNEQIKKILALEFNLTNNHTNNIISLIDDGCTIPFISRYRKEMTGSADDQLLRMFDDRLKYLTALYKRKAEITSLITDQGNMNDDISNAIESAITLTEVEDIYRPFRPKRKTRASVAIAAGLQGLADIILSQADTEIPAAEYINDIITDEEKAIKGACDIIAEMISDNAELRKVLRAQMYKIGRIRAIIDDKQPNAHTYEMYAHYDSAIKETPSHRILALNRGEKEGVLKVSLYIDIKHPLLNITSAYIKNDTHREMLEAVSLDAYNRLISGSIEREVRAELTSTANEQAIKMFEVNLRPLLLQPKLKGCNVLAVDPAYRTGCKIAVVDESGAIIAHTVVYPTPPQSKVAEAEAKLTELIKRHNVKVIAIGNGTATKESETFVAGLIKKIPECGLAYAIVNEAGASVYSASKLAAKELPEYDVSIRSAVSIARRLQDPLSELIKIDVRSIGVGQYQHDMPQARLSDVLDGVVEDCVNKVGVDINTASPSLLSYVSGFNKAVAENIVKVRNDVKNFTNLKQLLSVPRLGDKAYQQAAGFLRLLNGDNPLDNTGVHPENYKVAEQLLSRYGMTTNDIFGNADNIKMLNSYIDRDGINNVSSILGIGEITLIDIVNDLGKPNRDVRDDMPMPVLKSELIDISNLSQGMILSGVVRNVIDFGVFVDIGVHQDGLVHISEISDSYIQHPSEVLKVGDNVEVYILGVDVEKKRISLSIKKAIKEKK